jgi:phage-related protein
VGKGDTITQIANFLDSHAGATSFYWTPPLRSQGLYRCASYTLTPNGGDAYTLAATFQEVFA